MRHTAWMHSETLYHHHRFPAEIISHCVWLYFRFVLSFRDVEEMLAMRGVRPFELQQCPALNVSLTERQVCKSRRRRC